MTRWLGLIAGMWAAVAMAADPYGTGVEAFRRGDLAGALEAFRSAARDAPDNLAVTFALAQTCQALFERTGLYYQEGRDAYDRVIRGLDPRTPPDSPFQMARLFLGTLLVRGGEYDRAVEVLQGFLEAKPDYWAREEVWNTLGVAHYYRNDYREAVRAFERALKVDPEFGPARFNLRSVFTRLSLFDIAMANRRAGRLSLALGDLDRLLRLAPRFHEARLQKALVLRDLDRPDEALAEARRALSGDPPPRVAFELNDLVGDLLAARGDRAGAVAAYRRCLRIFPGYVQVVEKIDRLERREGGEEPPAAAAPPARTATPVAEFPM
ncbi:tetratricopeptide repeat protein [Deferrisoma camini]|uniref:tetratricopeptide repeat protein n=1 Tax=Deferrisoma camini TaxID=1035120 RepID=UPI00146E45BE|nr:tetratricopeptide repeat protein [Deferrisoma camini]